MQFHVQPRSCDLALTKAHGSEPWTTRPWLLMHMSLFEKHTRAHLNSKMGFEICVWRFLVLVTWVASIDHLYPYFVLASNWEQWCHPVLAVSLPFPVQRPTLCCFLLKFLMKYLLAVTSPANLINLDHLALLPISSLSTWIPVYISERGREMLVSGSCGGAMISVCDSASSFESSTRYLPQVVVRIIELFKRGNSCIFG